MNIEEVVRNEVRTKDGVHYLENHHEFMYSDVTHTEVELLSIIRRARDISSWSRELEGYIRDWPTKYHLSRERSLAYRSLDIARSTRILEIGCGCGSVTRLLGEASDHVLALEVSPRKATITRARTRDLDSVNILSASFDQVHFSEKFDLVVCNGVLGFAPLFVKHADPQKRMIELLASLVDESGSLVVAMENKFGLRYFSSGREERTELQIDDLEGYPKISNRSQTLGIIELRTLLGSAFTDVEALVPLPDYKLPSALVRATLFKEANCAELFANWARFDFDSLIKPRLHERLFWSEIAKNDLLDVFSNSLFMVAGQRPTSFLDSRWRADIWSIGRKDCFNVKTTISVDESGAVQVQKSCIETGIQSQHTVETIKHQVGKSEWCDGPSVHTAIVRCLCRSSRLSRSELESRMAGPVRLWWEAVRRIGGSHSVLDGSVVDFNWQNSLLNRDAVFFIDREWVWQEPVDPLWLIYRSTTKFCEAEVYYLGRWGRVSWWTSMYTIVKAVGRITDIDVSLGGLLNAARNEVALQHAVAGSNVGTMTRFLRSFEPLKIRPARIAARTVIRRILRKMERLATS